MGSSLVGTTRCRPRRRVAAATATISVDTALEVLQRQLAQRETLERFRGVLQPSWPPPTAHTFPPAPPSPAPWMGTPPAQEPQGIYAREAVSTLGSFGSALGTAAATALSQVVRAAVRAEPSPALPSPASSIFARLGALLAPPPAARLDAEALDAAV